MVDIPWLVETGPCMKFNAGQRIPCPGGIDDASKAMYILLTGRVDVLKQSDAGGIQMVGSLVPGDVFGGREYFYDVDEFVYTAGIDCIVYVINRNSFNDLSWSQPDILFEVMGAAYAPLRKLTASQKSAMVSPAQESESKLKAAGVGKQTQAAKGPKQHKDPSSAPSIVLSPSIVENMLPPGHKGYPGITKPEYLRLVFPKDYECPLCKKSFQDYRVFRSKLYEASPIRYDLRRYYTDFMTEWYDVIVCRNCLFSTFHNYFTEPKPIKKERINDAMVDIRQQIMLNFDDERDIDYVFMSHYIAMVCADAFTGAGKQIKAKLWGNLSWLYEDVNDEDMAKYSAKMAAEAYETVYKESRLTPIQEQITCLSIAGMQFRAGIDDNIKKYLFTVKTMQTGDKNYSKLAEDFMYELSLSEGN